jgi:uncharacterized membrane protein
MIMHKHIDSLVLLSETASSCDILFSLAWSTLSVIKKSFMYEARHRSLIKNITWRIVASITTALLAYLVTGNWKLSFGIGSLDVIAKFILYYFHERAWNKLTWGKR